MGLSNSNPPTARVKLLVSPSSGRFPWSLLSWLTLGSGIVLLVAVTLSGARLIIDPYSPNWLKRAFPSLVNSFETPPQTLEEIKAELQAANLTAGTPIAWPNATNPQSWFYPILHSDGSIRELWVYRIQGERLQRMDQVAIRPLKESFITTPLVGTASQVASVDSDAHLSTMKIMPSPTAPWLLLEGQRRYGNTVMRYGQLLSYQTSSHRLHQLLRWSSPADQPLQWRQDETGHQLVVDHTVGLRPSLLLYQLMPNDPPQLKEVSLYRSVYEAELQTSLYDKALQLAQGAVWSHSLQMMESAKATLAQNWSWAAENQLSLIRLHAERTKAQTEQTWSSQQQHILTYLIDGQWNQALTTLEENPDIYPGTLKRLERDFESLWRQVTVHLQVHPKDPISQIWGALLVSARQSPEAGEDWLTQRKGTKKTLERLRAVGQPKPAGEVTLPEDIGAAGLAADTSPGRYLGLIGEAVAVDAPGRGWLRSQTLPTLVPGQTWYHVQVQQLQSSSGWGWPGPLTAANFWAESLSLRGQLQLANNNQATSGLAVHGVKHSGTQLTLLVIGPKLEVPSLVIAGSDFQWLTALPWRALSPLQVVVNSEEDSSAQVGDVTPASDADNAERRMAEALGQHLGITLEQTAQLFPHLRYVSLDLVGDTAVEHLFTIGHSHPPEFNLEPGKILILSSTGDLLYSDVNQPGTLLGMTPKSQQHPAKLVIEDAGRYRSIGL
ncbi:MAG: hypothetical protein AAFY17_00540 [Cyanobacteria bacterium J06642_11]